MEYGLPWSCYFGDNDVLFQGLKVEDLGSGCQFTVNDLDGFPQYALAMCDGRMADPPFYVKDGEAASGRANYFSTDDRHVLTIVGIGDWSTDSADIGFIQEQFLAPRLQNIQLEIQPALSFFSTGDSGQLSSWSLTGMLRFRNCHQVTGRDRWAAIDFTLTNSGSTRTLALSNKGTLICSASRVGDGVIALPANPMGIAGSVTVAFTGACSGQVYGQWPDHYNVYWQPRGSGAFSKGDPKGSVMDDRHSNAFAWDSGVLPGGTYDVLVTQVSDTGEESANLTTTAFVLENVPRPAGVPYYASGDGTATVIAFQASADAASSYNVYDGGTLGYLDLSTPTLVVAPGTGTLNATLPSVGTLTGTRPVMVRATLDGVEEGSVNILDIDYVSGVVTLPRPNAPGMGRAIQTSGRTLTVPWTLDRTGSPVAPTAVLLYAWPAGTTPSYVTPIGSSSIGPYAANHAVGRVSGTVASDGVWSYAVRTDSVNGTSLNVDFAGPVDLSVAAPPAPTFSQRE